MKMSELGLGGHIGGGEVVEFDIKQGVAFRVPDGKALPTCQNDGTESVLYSTANWCMIPFKQYSQNWPKGKSTGKP